MEKYGFVYIWYDRKHKRYYIGAHWGTKNDSYLCSSRWMRASYNRRPQDFKRRIIATGFKTKKEMFEEENKWLQLMKEEELGKRYYNLQRHWRHWSSSSNSKSIGKKISISLLNRSEEEKEETRKKQSEAKKGKKYGPMSEERKWAISEAKKRKPHVYTEEQKQKMRESRKKYIANNYDKIVAINREITSKPEWRKQRSEKQKELHKIPGYTVKRIQAMKKANCNG